MKIIVNGTQQQFPEPIALAQLIANLHKEKRAVVAEVNGQIINASQWTQKTLADGDIIELVSIVGGG